MCPLLKQLLAKLQDYQWHNKKDPKRPANGERIEIYTPRLGVMDTIYSDEYPSSAWVAATHWRKEHLPTD